MRRSQHRGKLFRITEKGINGGPGEGRHPNTNIESWEVIRWMFTLRDVIPFEDLVTATTGHVHGTQGMDGRDSSSFINYVHRMGWLERVDESA